MTQLYTTKAPLNPHTVAMLKSLPSETRRIHAQRLQGQYELKLNRLRRAAHKVAPDWFSREEVYLKTCIRELTNIVNDKPTFHTYAR